MKEAIRIQEVINNKEKWLIVDVRSPGEYKAGHIPGALSIPLFSDDERARIGTLYKQISPEMALTEGLQIAGSKMGSLVEAALALYKEREDKKLLIQCWRGGKRSQAVEWLYSFSGMETYRLDGGYKSFRTALHTHFTDIKFDLRILGGCTGSGKTEILYQLSGRGEQVIDLEKLAHHKGSAFGSIGEEDQPSNEQFENNLFEAFLQLDPQKPIWIENESKSIGKVYIPDGLWGQMRNAFLYTIDVNKEVRLNRALKYYSDPVDIELLKASFEKIHERLGGLDFKLAIQALDHHDLKEAGAIALKYYDKFYTFQLNNWPKERVVYLNACEDVFETTDRLLSGNVLMHK